ncbi:DUF6065 family protein [Devosia insulae]|nr:DUF6065 family protein [Devosia insulae]
MGGEDLICFPMGNLPAQLRAGDTDRAWMDATPNAYAYRCLPLTIANGLGWQVLNPRYLEAVWDGGDGLDAVRLHADGDSIAISHFGSGILTFHVNALFRTPPGVSMLVTGPFNEPKDAIVALSGVVETDWSPYTFTMNWKFTRPDTVVKFEAGEPIATLVPLELGRLEQLRPQTRHLASEPELAEQNAMWTESRNSFNKGLEVPGSDAQQQRWQKLYHRGSMPDGSPAARKHRTRLRMAAFQSPD